MKNPFSRKRKKELSSVVPEEIIVNNSGPISKPIQNSPSITAPIRIRHSIVTPIIVGCSGSVGLSGSIGISGIVLCLFISSINCATCGWGK